MEVGTVQMEPRELHLELGLVQMELRLVHMELASAQMELRDLHLDDFDLRHPEIGSVQYRGLTH